MNRRVLIIEDDRVAGMLLQECFEQRNIPSDLITDRDFRRVLFDHMDHKYRLVITDLYMDDITGVEVLKWIRRAYPGLRVLAFSSEPTLSIGDFDGYIHKPVDCDEVHALIDHFYYRT